MSHFEQRELSEAIDVQLAALETIWRDDVPALNQRITAAGVDLLSTATD